ncbi:Uncharacterised protein [[Clostridium] symbiosum]|uniref:Peptidase M50 domain-containing protein n=1 Tax=[Clostridium] symbiosum ATCC 14940 TaxID=411472 RepID=A0ABC9TSP8_CLOSY|nr:hypothetical protein [[Clostridium] symbiosum]ERI74310.1 hypothetical protein CLOSYM_04070 [[Clostridium] symbiosum ATCC 14940]SUY59175.1 Uncharacterised protein [[Clostridium] symbiosum]
MMTAAKQNFRKLGGLFIAVLLYYIIHEGAHLLLALLFGTFRQIKFIGMGIQIDTYREQMNQVQTAAFCIAGAAATTAAGWMLLLATDRILESRSLTFRAAAFYTTLVFLLNDPFYLSILYPYVGGGDMNGIRLLIPELPARVFFALLLITHLMIIARYLYPVYKKAFVDSLK